MITLRARRKECVGGCGRLAFRDECRKCKRARLHKGLKMQLRNPSLIDRVMKIITRIFATKKAQWKYARTLSWNKPKGKSAVPFARTTNIRR